MSEYYECPFGLRGIKIQSYKNLQSPPKPEDIQITVCASTWNRKKEVITKSIKSIFDQPFPTENYEAILVDDATEGPRAKDLREAIIELMKEYPNHNFRAYFTSHTRCWTDPHTLNVAFKRALGWIIMISQVDIIHIGETLEATWRHHNTLNNLWLCPKHYSETEISKGMEDAKPWPFCYFPHEFGASVKKEHIHKIKGRNEKIISEPPDVEFHVYLQKVGVVFGEDKSIQTLHLHDAHDGCSRNFRKPPNNLVQNIGLMGRPNLAWTDGDWGALTPEEKNKVIMTEGMKKCLRECG